MDNPETNRTADPDQKRLGKLLLIGGNEDKEGAMDILRTIVAEAGGASARIEVITTASTEPLESGKRYVEVFSRLGVGYVKAMHISSRAEAGLPEFPERIDRSNAVFLTGGDQLRITSILDATPVADALRRHYFDHGALLAGTSAGAAAVTSTIIYDGESPVALRKGGVKMTGGLSLLTDTIVDTHFVIRGRFGRLVQVVAGSPGLVGIGLGEDAGILISGGSFCRVVGGGLVMIVDGRDIGFTNVTEVEAMEPFSVENVRVHVLSPGSGYDLKSHAFVPPPRRLAAPSPAKNDSSR